MRDRLLERLAALAWSRSGPVVGLAVALALGAALLAVFELRLNADTDDLIAPDRPYMKTYRAFLEEAGDLEFLYVVVDHGVDPAQASPEEFAAATARAEAAVDSIAAELEGLHVVPQVFARIEPEEQLRVATRAMPDAELAEFAAIAAGIPALASGDPAAIARDARLRLNRLIAAGGLMSDEAQRRLGAASILQARCLAAALEDSASARELAPLLAGGAEPEYLVSSSGRLHFIRLMPVKDYGTMAVIAEPLRKIREVVDRTRPGVQVGLTGKPVLQADEMATTDRDMTRASIIAIVGVALLFLLIIGGGLRPILAVLALLIGIAWTFGVTTLVVGQLNLLSVVFTLILVGIGIDFGVHVLARYREARRDLEVGEALRHAVVTAGRGNASGAVTTSLAFLTAMITGFRGLQELGFIAGAGLVLCLVAMTVVLPAMIALLDRRKRELEPWNDALPGLPESGRGSGALLLAAGLATLVLLPGIARVGFDENLLELQAQGLDSVKWEKRVIDDAGAETWFGVSLARDLDEVAAISGRARAQEEIGSVHSVLDVVKPETAERRALRALLAEARRTSPDAGTPPRDAALECRELAQKLMQLARLAAESEPEEARGLSDLARDLERLSRRLGDETEGAAARERLDAVCAEVGGALGAMLRGDGTPLQEALPEALRALFMTPTGRFVVMMHPTANVWDTAVMRPYVAALRRVDPGVTGVPITQSESIADMRRGFGRAALLAFLCVLGVVLLDFRRPVPTLLALTPLLVGGLWLLGLMGWFGVDFNLANFFAVPILIGIGVDNGIHLVHRWREAGGGAVRFGATARGVLLTSLTTAVGFGCLVLASHRGLRSLGLVMAMGSLAILFASLLLLPAILRRMHGRGIALRSPDRGPSPDA